MEAASFSLLVGLAWTACFAVATVGQLNLISVAFAVLFIGFGVDFGIHFCMRAKEYIDAGLDTGLALEEAAAGGAPGLTPTTISASIGFLAFLPTDYSGLVELGIISSAGMVSHWRRASASSPRTSRCARRASPMHQQRAIGFALERAWSRRARSIVWGALALGAPVRGDPAVRTLRRLAAQPARPEDGGRIDAVRPLRDARFDPFRAAVLARDRPGGGDGRRSCGRCPSQTG